MSVYCIVRCPYCKGLQGGQHPVKRVKCRTCSKVIKVDRIGVIATYDNHAEMQISLRKMKWGGLEPPEANEILPVEQSTSSPNKSGVKGKDHLRRSIIKRLESISERNEMISSLVLEGYDIETIEDAIDELISQGLVYSPKYGSLKKV